jgi:hypothetical protein
MRAFANLENLVQGAFDRTTRRYHRAMSEDTQSPFEATRALKHQERNLGGASFVGQDVSSPVSAKNNVEERKNNVEESKQTKQSREEMREEGQSGEGKSNEA